MATGMASVEILKIETENELLFSWAWWL